MLRHHKNYIYGKNLTLVTRVMIENVTRNKASPLLLLRYGCIDIEELERFRRNKIEQRIAYPQGYYEKQVMSGGV